jgi:hypothetical protein
MKERDKKHKIGDTDDQVIHTINMNEMRKNPLKRFAPDYSDYNKDFIKATNKNTGKKDFKMKK